MAFIRGRTIGQRVAVDGQRCDDLTGKFVMLLKRKGDGWVIGTLIWNPDL